MFSLSKIKDTMAIQPSMFGIDPAEAIAYEIDKKYANRVLHDVGLCICLFDIVDVSEGKVRFGDGCLWHKVTFRMVIFRPFVGEVFTGQVASVTEEGIEVSLPFFDDVWVPRRLLPENTTFDPDEKLLFWPPALEENQNPLDTVKETRFYIDLDRPIRVCVDSDEFCDDEPGPPRRDESGNPITVERRPPYSIICSAASSGLGPVEWWPDDAEDGVDREGDAVMDGESWS